MYYKVEVVTDNSGTWAGNSLCFETQDKAIEYALDLNSRWTMVKYWRVIEINDQGHRRETHRG